MRIIFHFASAMIGGHVLSAMTQAAALARRGNEVLLACDDGPLLETAARYGLKREYVPFRPGRLEGNYFFNRHTIGSARVLQNLLRRFRPDVVNSFDVPATVQASICSLFTPVPTVQTICGGMVPEFSPAPTDGVIVFSRELDRGVRSRYPWTEGIIWTIPHRVDLNDRPPREVDRDRELLGWDEATRGVLMISRLNVNKRKAVEHFIAAMSRVAEIFPEARGAVVGGGKCYEELLQLARKANAGAGMEIVRLPGSVPEAARLVEAASIVLGVGRAAFEGMRASKPTLIVGENGFAGEVSPRNIEALSYYNFSGRNVPAPAGPEELADAILKILRDRELAEELGSYGRSYLETSLDVDVGAPLIEEVYRTVTASFSPSPSWRMKRTFMLLKAVTKPALLISARQALRPIRRKAT